MKDKQKQYTGFSLISIIMGIIGLYFSNSSFFNTSKFGILPDLIAIGFGIYAIYKTYKSRISIMALLGFILGIAGLILFFYTNSQSQPIHISNYTKNVESPVEESSDKGNYNQDNETTSSDKSENDNSEDEETNADNNENNNSDETNEEGIIDKLSDWISDLLSNLKQ